MKTFASICTGGGLADVGAMMAGYKPIWGIEIEPAIAEVARHNLEHDVITKSVLDVAPSTLERPDVLWASPPCFPAGVKVLTSAGLKDISEVEVGDMVLTHKGRWRTVKRTMTRKANTVILHGLGHWGLEATPNHPFFASEIVTTYPPYKERCPGNYSVKSMATPSWVNAESMVGKHWLSLSDYPAVKIDEIEYSFHEALRGQKFDLSDPNFWWVVGAWLGNGWVRYSDGKGRSKSRGTVYVRDGNHEADELENRLNLAGLRFNRSQESTATRFSIESRPLARWLTRNFGKYAHGKTIPVWAYGMPEQYRKALLDGFIFTDGHTYQPPTFCNPTASASTASSDLAISIKILGTSLGYSVAVRRYHYRQQGEIEGRTVSERPSHTIQITSSDRHSRKVEHESVSYKSGCVRKIEVGREDVDVYDITVDEDESFIADGIIVHNCPNFSVAKANAQETELDIALAQAIVDFISTLQPPIFILENVEGYKRSKSLKFIEGALYALGYWIDRQVVNAADFGVPQTRKRLILRAVLGGFPPPLPQKEKWVGWYEAIADLIPTLPESKLAQWQIDRLPEPLVSCLFQAGNPNGNRIEKFRRTDYPAPTVCASEGFSRAVLVTGLNQCARDCTTLDGEAPSSTVTAGWGRRPINTPKAILVPGGNASSFSTRNDDEPARTIGDTERVGNLPRAVLISGTGDRGETVAFREGHEPSLTVTKSSDRQASRAWIEPAKVVAMTPRALARFQTLPDWYELPEKNQLACKIIGNGVPCLLVEKLLRLLD